MSSLIDTLLNDIASDTAISDERRELLRELLARVVAVAEAPARTDDLHVAVQAIDELLEAFALFEGDGERRKITIFGSARTPPDSPIYQMTVELARAMAQRDWIIVSGAGPGIMEASARGAGEANTIGINIRLPFEQTANPYIAATNLVTMKYFFTRKVALTRPSIAFVVLPGGLGTMDELFEVLTLLDTGKTTPAPVVLLDTPEGKFWQEWLTFMDRAIVKNHYVATDDMFIVRLATSIEETVDEIEHFYSNYRGFDIDGERGLISLHRTPTPDQIHALARVVPLFADAPGYRLENPTTVSFNFDGRNYVNLRLLIDEVNSWRDN
ncbi:MAG: TIGR00730 family Rossman fold protein [Acidimicrobiales bacterium]